MPSIPPPAAGLESLEVYILSKELLLSLVDHCSTHNISSFSDGVLVSAVENLEDPRLPVRRVIPPRLRRWPAISPAAWSCWTPWSGRSSLPPTAPIKTKDQSNPSTYYGPGAKSLDFSGCRGCIIEGEVENCILFRGVHVQKGARVSNCVLMQGTVVQSDAVLKYVITDKNVQVNPGRMLMGHSSYPLAIAKNEIV